LSSFLKVRWLKSSELEELEFLDIILEPESELSYNMVDSRSVMRLMVKQLGSSHLQEKSSNLEAKIIFLKRPLSAILPSLRLGEPTKEEIFNSENLLEISTKMLLQLERYVSQKLKKLFQSEPSTQIRCIYLRCTLIELSKQRTLLRE